jgi:sulfate permease, SulP family
MRTSDPASGLQRPDRRIPAAGAGHALRLLATVLPAAGWLRAYRREFLSSDLSAGLTVAVLLIPQSMAYAALAGMPPEAGLYSAIVSLLVYAALGSSSFISVAPVAIDSLLVAAAVGPIAQGDTGLYVAAAGVLAIMTGVIQLALGVLRLGALVNFLSVPVISGFTSAAALTIGASQLKDLLGLELATGQGSSFLGTLDAAVAAAATIDGLTTSIAVASLVALVVARRVAPKVPAALVVVAASTATVALLRLDREGVAILGEVPAGLPSPVVPAGDLDLVRLLLPAAVTIAVISYMESISTAKAFATRTRTRVHPNQELLAVGAANVAAGVFRGFSVAGGFSRGAVNFRAGARTQLSGVTAAVVLLLAVAFLTPLFFYLPKAALAAVIVVAVATLVDVAGARRILRVQRADGVGLLVTFFATLLIGVAQGLAVGVLASLLVFIARTARPHVVEVGRVKGTARYRNVQRWSTRTDERIALLRMDGPLYFANARFFEQRAQSLVSDRPLVEHLVVVASAIGDIDASGAELLIELDDELRDGGVQLHLVTVRGPVRDTLANTDLWEKMMTTGRIHTTIEGAVRTIAGPDGSVLLKPPDEEPAPADLV